MEWKPPGCKSVSNLDLDYPQCCPQIVCPEDTKDSKDYGARGNQDKSDAVSNLHCFILALQSLIVLVDERGIVDEDEVVQYPIRP